MRFLAVLAVLWCTPALSFAADLVATSDPGGGVVIKEGEHVVARVAPKTPVGQRGPASVRSVTVSGRHVIEVRIPMVEDPPGRSEVWIGERAGAGATTVWTGMAGARDADGETTLEVRVSSDGIEQFQTARRLSRCDGEAVPLFRKRWDFKSRTFVPAPPDLPARSAITVQAHRGGAPEGKASGGFFFSAASSSPGMDSDAARLRPPAALNDENPETVWMSEGDARGQTLTARSSGGFPIIGVRLLPGDTRTEKDHRASAKPRHMTLVFGKDTNQNVDVDVVDDANAGAKRYREPFWIALPKPVASTCISVIVRDATGEKAPLAIADMAVLTELDGPNAADRLVQDLAQANNCVARLPLLTRLGASGLAKVEAAIPQTAPGRGRECLMEALAALVAKGERPGPEAAKALVAALDRTSEEEQKILFSLLPTLEGSSVPAVAAVLADAKRTDVDRARAAEVLARMKSAGAAAALMANVGSGSAGLRKSVRAAAIATKVPALDAVLNALSSTPAAEHARRADLLWVAAGLADQQPVLRPQVRGILESTLHADASFEERARAIQGLGMLHDPQAIVDLADVRAHASDGVLRSLAASELATSETGDTLPVLRDALSDADPRVRETAAEALGRKNDKAAAKQLVDAAKQEPWPSVRKAEVIAVGELCTPEGNDLLIRAFQRDVEEVRQAALTGIAHCYGEKATGTLLRTLGRLPESADMRSQAARLLGQRKDPRLGPGLKEVLSRLLRESEADLSLEGVVADTAIALGELRTPEAISALVGLLSDPRVSIKRIAIDALGMICDPGQGTAALHAAAQARDEAVSIPAAAAERNCRDRRAH